MVPPHGGTFRRGWPPQRRLGPYLPLSEAYQSSVVVAPARHWKYPAESPKSTNEGCIVDAHTSVEPPRPALKVPGLNDRSPLEVD